MAFSSFHHEFVGHVIHDECGLEQFAVNQRYSRIFVAVDQKSGRCLAGYVQVAQPPRIKTETLVAQSAINTREYIRKRGNLFPI